MYLKKNKVFLVHHFIALDTLNKINHDNLVTNFTVTKSYIMIKLIYMMNL